MPYTYRRVVEVTYNSSTDHDEWTFQFGELVYTEGTRKRLDQFSIHLSSKLSLKFSLSNTKENFKTYDSNET